MPDAIAALGLSANQLTNTRGIIRATKARGWPKKPAIVAIAAAKTEAGLRVLASANVPESQKYPHDLLNWTDDGLGHDHASCGMYQQQTGWKWTPAGYGRAMNQTTMNSPDGWGEPRVLMDPEKSTALFFNSLAKVSWLTLPRWEAAQAVQHSAFADGSNYREQDDEAVAIVDALWNESLATIKKVSVMYELIQDAQTKVWYAFAAGFWYRVPNVTELSLAAHSQLCANRGAILTQWRKPAKRQDPRAFQFSHAQIAARRDFALAGASS